MFDTLKHAERRLAAGEILFRRNSPVRWLHRIERGMVELVRYGENGQVCVLQNAGPGQFLAEASLFSDRYHCDAIAVGEAIVGRFNKSHVIAAFHHDAAASLQWSQYLSREVQHMRARAEILSMRRLEERLEAWLTINDSVLPQKGSWSNVAREIGVTPEALYRHLAKRRA